MAYIEQIFNLLQSILGFSPLLMLPVFVTVSLISKLFGIKKRYGVWKDFYLGLLCLGIGIIVAYFTGYTDIKMILKTGLILGSVCALTYQIFVSLFEGLVSYIDKKMDKVLDEDVDVQGSDLFQNEEDGGNDDN